MSGLLPINYSPLNYSGLNGHILMFLGKCGKGLSHSDRIILTEGDCRRSVQVLSELLGISVLQRQLK